MPFSFFQQGAGLFFGLEVEGETQVMGALTGLLKRVRDLRPVWNPIEFVLRRSVTQMFETEGGGRFKWPPLAPSTVADRLRHGFPGEHPILVRTGKMREAFIRKGHSEHIFVSHRQYMDFGAKIDYAPHHQKPTGHGKLPRRPMIYIDKGDVNDMVRFIRQYIADNTVFRR